MATGDILVVGKGAREHALIWKLRQSPHVASIYAAPGNPGTEKIATNIPIEQTDISSLFQFAREKDIDLTIIGPELPLQLDIVSVFRQVGLDIFGPTASAARIETSKSYAKRLMLQVGIPTAPFKVFNSYQDAYKHIHERNFPLVIKADGLASGKGVSVCQEMAQAELALKEMMIDRVHGSAGDVIIIEDCLEGKEISIHALCNETLMSMFPPARDSKALKDDNKGQNTGGMSAFAPVPTFTRHDLFHVEQTIVKRILKALMAKGSPFTGCLYPGLMITSDGPKVLEFNSRFGDPETQPLMMLTKSDLFLALKACTRKDCAPVLLSFSNKYAVCVVLCSKEYPAPINNPVRIYGLEEAERVSEQAIIFQGATQRIGCHLYTNGGRILSIVAQGNTLKEARNLAYLVCDHIDFEGKQYRSDTAKNV